MHFEGVVARWLKSAERRIRLVHWYEFCSI
jgi:hypothetical protein